MDQISELLPAQPRASLWRAAAITAAANQAIKETLPEIVDEARAVSVKHETIYVRVSHGAVAGMINMEQGAIMKKINAALRRRGLGSGVKKIVTRND